MRKRKEGVTQPASQPARHCRHFATIKRPRQNATDMQKKSSRQRQQPLKNVTAKAPAFHRRKTLRRDSTKKPFAVAAAAAIF